MPGVVSAPSSGGGSPVAPSPFEPSSWVRLVRPLTARTRFVSLPAQLVCALATGTVRARGASQPSSTTWSDGSPLDDASADEATSAAPAAAAAAADEEEEAVGAAIEAAIAELRGAVCPKVGAACPSDAAWATFSGSARCESAGEVLTIVQASERATAAMRGAHGPVALALRQWADVDRRMEFRGFVRDNELVALCPRAAARFPPNEAHMDRVAEASADWLTRRVHPRVRDLFGERYVIDFYVDRGWTLWIVDFAPWGVETNPLLFQWPEVERAPWMNDGGRAQFRCSDEGAAIRPAEGMYHGIPLELRNPDAGAALAEAAREIYERERERGNADEGDK